MPITTQTPIGQVPSVELLKRVHDYCVRTILKPDVDFTSFSAYLNGGFPQAQFPGGQLMVSENPSIFFPPSWLISNPSAIVLKPDSSPDLINFLRNQYQNTHITNDPFAMQNLQNQHGASQKILTRAQDFFNKNFNWRNVLGFIIICGIVYVLYLLPADECFAMTVLTLLIGGTLYDEYRYQHRFEDPIYAQYKANLTKQIER